MKYKILYAQPIQKEGSVVYVQGHHEFEARNSIEAQRMAESLQASFEPIYDPAADRFKSFHVLLLETCAGEHLYVNPEPQFHPEDPNLAADVVEKSFEKLERLIQQLIEKTDTPKVTSS